MNPYVRALFKPIPVLKRNPRINYSTGMDNTQFIKLGMRMDMYISAPFFFHTFPSTHPCPHTHPHFKLLKHL